MKPIETIYAGCRFRSRLEARWAVFFDVLGIKWEYEPQGFAIGEPYDPSRIKWHYLPDFYLSDLGIWVEVKGQLDDHVLEQLCYAACPHGGLKGGILLLGNVPDPREIRDRHVPVHFMLTFHKGDVAAVAYTFTTDTFTTGGRLIELKRPFVYGPTAYYDDIKPSFVGPFLGPPPSSIIWQDCGQYYGMDWYEPKDLLHTWYDRLIPESESIPETARAYAAARSARFEHDNREQW